MSTLRVNAIQDVSGSGQPGISGLAKAWVNFNGTGTVAIRASFNVSSITDHGTGNYSVNFTSALADGNFVVSGMTCAEGGESDTREMCVNMNQAFNQTTCGVLTTYQNATRTDRTQVHIAVFR